MRDRRILATLPARVRRHLHGLGEPRERQGELDREDLGRRAFRAGVIW